MKRRQVQDCRILLLVVLISLLTPLVDAETLHVDSKNGNDTNPGTKDRPLCTLGKAVTLVNSNGSPGPTTIKIVPGIYNLTQTLVLKNSRRYTEKERMTIEASVLPDDPGWMPHCMPMIFSTEDPRDPKKPDLITGTYGIKIKISHVTIRGLKFLGNPVPNNMYAPIERIDKGLVDLLVTQCMFVGDKDSFNIYCPAIATENQFVVAHCIFHNCHASAVFWDGPESISGKNNAMRYCIVDGGYISGPWTCRTAEDFEFHHNIINDTEYFWMREKIERPKRYKVSDCIINVNKFSGYGVESGPIGETGSEIAFDLKNVIKSARVSLVEDKNKREYLHVVPGTFGSDLGAGLFKQLKQAEKEQKKIKEGFTNANNVKLFYKMIGEGEPVVVLHGGPGFDHEHVLDFMVLGDEYNVIFYDQRATGNSTGEVNANSITVDNFVEDLEGLRKALKLKKMHVIGHSWGGGLGMFYGIKYPGNLKSLVLLGAAGSSEFFGPYLEEMESRTSPEDKTSLEEIAKSEAFAKGDIEAFERYYKIAVKPIFYDKSLIDTLDWKFSQKTAKNQRAVAELLMKDLGEYDILDELSVIECPVLVVHGDYDCIPFEALYKVHKHLPQSQFLVLKDAGHFMFVESRDKLFSTIRNFLRKR